MLTETGAKVDGGGEWVTQAELARLKSVSKQAISKRWKRFKAEGLINPRQEGRSEIVLLAEWDTVTNDATDPAKLLPRQSDAGDPLPAPSEEPSGDPGYTAERARSARYDADLKKIRLDQELGRLVPVEEVAEAMARCAEQVVRDIDQLPSMADEVAAAMAESGVTGVKQLLKEQARKMRETLELNMRLLASEDGEDEDYEDDGQSCLTCFE